MMDTRPGRQHRTRPTTSPDRDAETDRCTDLWAPHDLAALAERNLSPLGMHRLADHVVGCQTCRIVLAGLIGDAADRVDGTGMHAIRRCSR